MLCKANGRGFKELKALVANRTGGFRATVSGILDIQKTQAYALMKLANEWPVDWDRWQEICGNKQPAKPAPVKTPTPDPDDLSHTAKLIA